MTEGLAERALRLRTELAAAERELCAVLCRKRAGRAPERAMYQLRAEVLALAAKTGSVTTAQMAVELRVQRHSARSYLSRLATAGIVERVAVGTYRPLPERSAVEGLVC